jgi:hypothetical protein
VEEREAEMEEEATPAVDKIAVEILEKETRTVVDVFNFALYPSKLFSIVFR